MVEDGVENSDSDIHGPDKRGGGKTCERARESGLEESKTCNPDNFPHNVSAEEREKEEMESEMVNGDGRGSSARCL